MTALRTPKENFLDMSKGIVPDYIPQYSFFPSEDSKRAMPVCLLIPALANDWRKTEEKVDLFGVKWVATKETGGALLPEPNRFILKDIRKWRDVVKLPDIRGIDWERMAKKDLEASEKLGIDYRETAKELTLHVGYFQTLMALMGFTEGLMALYEEPEECKALLSALCDFWCAVYEKCFDYYQPDIFGQSDDTAAWKNPFISLDMYRDIFKPLYIREAKFGMDRGLPGELHCCGKCEMFVDDWNDFGIRYWNPAQTSNDLDAIKKKHPRDLVIVGGWDYRGRLCDDGITEEEFKQSIVDCYNRLAPDGGFVSMTGVTGDPNNETVKKKNRWCREVADTYGEIFYNI
jgi:hypothetical protein